ncbi:terpenoid synthase [Meira miltonrushii]|uniref:(2E,6E)-farnesyl diphosphate synthase n=1 Tax=Meira miltonrushii TaxID=1280837 RepID=A0A316VIG9_9BASI|nr:terpenoid synthase [Meira miltonrushii]PWN37429.1 terpenoid synthase [Meira miltonrushii]
MNGHSSAMPDPSWYAGVRDILASQSKWTEPNERALLGAYDYLDANPGHGARSKLIDTLDWWLKVPQEKLKRIDDAIRMLHTSSLMIDDIEDGSELRRGRPSSHMVYGVPLTINAANYVYFLGINQLIEMSDVKVPGHTPLMNTEGVQRMMMEEMINLHRGQGMELYLRENFICPSEEEYIQMVNNKTGGLFRVACRLMIGQSSRLKSVAEGDPIVTLINLIGLQYQIRDDYMNLRSGDYTQNKGYCDDLSEGKFSFPLIHAITASRLMIGEKNNGLPIAANKKRAIVQYMQDRTNSFRYTCQVLLHVDRQIRHELRRVEHLFDGGKPNEHIRAYITLLRSGWYRSPDCPPTENDTPYEAI